MKQAVYIFSEQDDFSAISDFQSFASFVPRVSNKQVDAAQHFPSQL